MTLEEQVTSLELSKRLNELGVKQESLFCWLRHKKLDKKHYLSPNDPDYNRPEYNLVSAFTVAELGEMLNWGIIDFDYSSYGLAWLEFGKLPSKSYFVALIDRECLNKKSIIEKYPDWYEKSFFRGKTEADARAKMLIYLIEQKLINVGDIGNKEEV